MALSALKRIQMINQPQSFKTQLNSSEKVDFKVNFNAQNLVIPTQLEKVDSEITTKADLSSNTIESSGVINNNPKDEFYDEIIYYDGGGVEGYGY